MRTSEIRSASTADLLATYNRLTGESVKRFSTRAAAEKRTAAAIAEFDSKADLKIRGKNLAESISLSWRNPEIAAKRLTRNHVRVGGAEYRSVKAAFVSLRLSLAKHIPFRMELKAAGRATFLDDNGKSYTFVNLEA